MSSGSPEDEQAPAVDAIQQSPYSATAPLNVEAHEGPDYSSKAATQEPMLLIAPELRRLEGRLARLEESTEVEFIRREARFIPSLINLWSHFKLFGGRKDPRSRAAVSSTLWRIFSPGAVAAASGGLLMLAFTLMQAFLLWQQNSKLDQQTHVMQAQTNSAVVAQLGPLMERLAEHTEMLCLSDKGLATFASALTNTEVQKNMALSMAPRCWSEVGDAWRIGWIQACAQDSECKAGVQIRSYQNSQRVMEAVGETQSTDLATVPLPPKHQAMVAAVTQSARPYRFLDMPLSVAASAPTPASGVSMILRAMLESGDTPKLIERPLSPERGQLLVLLLQSGFLLERGPIDGADFSSAYAYRAKLEGSHIARPLHSVFFPYANFQRAVFNSLIVNSDFPCADFEGSDMSAADITGGNYAGAGFTVMNLPRADRFNPGRLDHANFDESIVHEKDFVEKLAAKKIRGFDASMWKVEEVKGELRIAKQRLVAASPCY